MLITHFPIQWRCRLTLSLPRVIYFKFLLQPHQKYYITHYEELGFSYLPRWKIILPILTTSLIGILFKRLGECTLELGSETLTYWWRAASVCMKNTKQPNKDGIKVTRFNVCCCLACQPRRGNFRSCTSILYVTFLMERGNREKTRTRSNAFGNRLNAFAFFFPIPLFIR